MKALRFENNSLSVAEIPVPDFADEALIRVHRAGICATDVAIMHGYAGFSGTLGHEFVGTVERAPDPAWVGRRVVGDINLGCGECRLCQSGDSRHCPLRHVLGIRTRDGAFAEYLSLPIRNLHLVPDTVTDTAAVFAEPLAAACQILSQITFSQEMNILILGDGKLAQLIGRALQVHHLSPTLIGKHLGKLHMAQAGGIQTQLLEEVESDRGLHHSADVVIEATGRSEGFALALKLVRPLGTVVLKSTLHGAWALRSEKIVVPEITIVGSRCGRMEPALALLEAGQVEVASLISAEFDLSDGVAAFAAAQQPNAMKVQLRMA